VFDRVHSLRPSVSWREKIHILDLKEDGEIKHHIDSVDAFGSTIAGISLLSDCVLNHKDDNTGSIIDVHIPARSLYIMKDFVRYNYSHAIQREPTEIHGRTIHKKRRISLLLRDKK